jgi:hypothetical protein
MAWLVLLPTLCPDHSHLERLCERKLIPIRKQDAMHGIFLSVYIMKSATIDHTAHDRVSPGENEIVTFAYLRSQYGVSVIRSEK